MAIIAFWSDEEKETGQTLSMVALSTYMAIEHSYKILNVSANFKDRTMEKCYFDEQKQTSIIKGITRDDNIVNFDTGIEGLTKVIKSNRTSSNIVSNYCKVIFNGRLDLLPSPETKVYSEFASIASMYPDILQTANQCYDLVFVDVSKKLDQDLSNRILEIADIIIVNLTQRLSTIEKFLKLKEENSFFKNNNILLNIGRYDGFSKYNTKNITRYLKLKNDVLAVPYNTLFFESCSEGKAAEYFLKLRNIDSEDRNGKFVADLNVMAKSLIYKMQELQLNL